MNTPNENHWKESYQRLESMYREREQQIEKLQAQLEAARNLIEKVGKFLQVFGNDPYEGRVLIEMKQAARQYDALSASEGKP